MFYGEYHGRRRLSSLFEMYIDTYYLLCLIEKIHKIYTAIYKAAHWMSRFENMAEIIGIHLFSL
jgi:hypothetical protein